MWLSYRCFIAKGEEIIPLFGSFGLCAQIGSAEYARPRRFRENLDKWLDTVRLLWPNCPAKINADGQSLRIGKRCRCPPETPTLMKLAGGQLHHHCLGGMSQRDFPVGIRLNVRRDDHSGCAIRRARLRVANHRNLVSQKAKKRRSA